MDEKIAGFRRTIQRRNIRESAVAIFLAGLFGHELLNGPSTGVGTAGRVVMVFACLLIVTIIWSKLHVSSTVLVTFPPAQHPEIWRAYMNTQARWSRLAWLWYVLPLFVGIILIALGRSGEMTAIRAVSLLIAVILAVAIGLLNIQAAKRVEQDRDAWFGAESAADA